MRRGKNSQYSGNSKVAEVMLRIDFLPKAAQLVIHPVQSKENKLRDKRKVFDSNENLDSLKVQRNIGC